MSRPVFQPALHILSSPGIPSGVISIFHFGTRLEESDSVSAHGQDNRPTIKVMFFTGRGGFWFRSSNWMTIPFSLTALLFLSCACGADCLSKEDAGKHIGASKCVRGTVLHVKDGGRGATFLDFCDDYRSCPFTVVVFSRDLKRVGDVRYLQGKQIEIHGKI